MLRQAKLASYNASLERSSFILEASDIRDTTRIPDLICTFSIGSVSAGMDDMTLAIAAPTWKSVGTPQGRIP